MLGKNSDNSEEFFSADVASFVRIFKNTFIFVFCYIFFEMLYIYMYIFSQKDDFHSLIQETFRGRRGYGKYWRGRRGRRGGRGGIRGGRGGVRGGRGGIRDGRDGIRDGGININYYYEYKK